MNLKSKIFPFLSLGIGSMLLLTGCRDDDLYSRPSDADIHPEKASLVFDFALAPFASDGSDNSYTMESQHGEGWENFIDPSKFRVLFCDMEGDYLFEVDRRNISIISKSPSWSGSSGSDASTAYRVVLSRDELIHDGCGDEEKEKRHNEAIHKAIYETGFKVAVLANWPNMMEGKRDKDPLTGDEYLGGATENTDLDFEWWDTANGEENRPRNTKIGYLNQCIYDNVYGEPIVEGSTEYSPSYEHLVFKEGRGRGQMGVFTSWVSYLYKNQDEAAEFIRKGDDEDGDMIEGDVQFTYSYGFRKHGNTSSTNPEDFWYTPYSYTRTVDHENVYDLENIMRLWNFSAGSTCSYHRGMGSKASDYWRARNENVLVYELNKIDWGTDGSAFNIVDNQGEEVLSCTQTRTKYVPVSGTSGGYLNVPNGIRDTDVTSLQGGINDNNKATAQKLKDNAIHFRAYGEGILRIKAKVGGSGLVSVMTSTALKGSMSMVPVYANRNETEDYMYKPPTTTAAFEDVEFYINPNSEEYLDIYIASVNGTTMFYEIEYIRSRHIYDSARNAIMPSRENPIPMYGIQNFDPIGIYIDALPQNETFNMSDESYNSYLKGLNLPRYNYKDVYLLRSVAKVELRFRKSVFRKNPPAHVMMRVMNRTARCEPKDVVNPTDWIWYGNDGLKEGSTSYGPYNTIDEAANPDKFAGAEGEFNNIMRYYSEHPLYDPNESDVAVYRDLTSWFFGYWADTDASLDKKTHNKYYWQIPWNWNNMGITVPKTNYPYPRIFNTRIDRSDYCRFHKVGDDGEYIRYVMYVPEKNITDADSKGSLKASPKVQHVEIRFTGMNDGMNFDDDNCYRLYFTNYTDNGKSMKAVNRNGGYTAFEKDMNVLRTLQPIMRNCHYIFTINSINDEEIGVNYEVCGAQTVNSRPIVIN